MAPAEAVVAFQYGTGETGCDISEDGRRAFRQPRGVRVAPDGSLLVTDFGAHCVIRFAPNDARGRVVAGAAGKLLPTVDPLKDIDRPLGPPEGEGRLLKQPGDAHAVEGGVIVLDTECCRVQRFPADGGQAVVVAPPAGPSQSKSVHTPEALKYPRSVLPQPDGSLVVCDTWSHRVLRFAPPESPEALEKPVVLAGIPNSTGQEMDKLAFPSGVAFAADGALLVSDTNNHRIQRFEPGSNGPTGGAAGTTIAGSPAGEPGEGLGQLRMPTGICVDPRDGALLVADRCNGRVLRFPAGSRAGDEGEMIVGPDLLQRPWGVCLDAEGCLYVSDEWGPTVLKLEPSVLSPGPPPEPLRQSVALQEIASGTDGLD